MERLAHLTETDIRNGVLNQMLAKAGIPDVQEYIQKFHEETESKIVDDWQHSESNRIQDDEPIAPPADVQSWITGLRLRLDDPVVKPSELKPSQQQPPQPANLTSWMQGMAPVHLHSSTDINTTQTDITPTDSTDPIMPVAGNLGTWLTDWSRNLAQQPPPTSLDTWLKGLVSDNLHEPIGKAASSKGRLNSYLNAAQQVLSEHGYNVPNQTIPTNNVEMKTGMFTNVKQMYFLWKTLDKNNDRKITVEDVQILLEEMGLGFLSRYVGEALFQMVDSNHDGQLQFRDFVALMGIIKQLIGAVGSAKT